MGSAARNMYVNLLWEQIHVYYRIYSLIKLLVLVENLEVALRTRFGTA